MQKVIGMMNKEYIECVSLAEEKNVLSLVVEGNLVKQKSNKTKENFASVEKDTIVLQEKVKVYVLMFW